MKPARFLLSSLLVSASATACVVAPDAELTGASEDELTLLDFSFARRARAECERQLTCSPVPTVQWFGQWSTTAECVTKRVVELRELARTPGVTLTPGRQLTCANLVTRLTCFDWLRASMRGDRAWAIDACATPSTGRLAIGADCHMREQCASGVCQFDALAPAPAGGGFVESSFAQCGKCVAALPTGAPCSHHGPKSPACAPGDACLPGGVVACAPGAACTAPATPRPPEFSCQPAKKEPFAARGTAGEALGSSCADTDECAQPRNDYAVCDAAAHTCRLASRTRGAACSSDDRGYGYMACNTDQAGLECADECPEWSFIDEVTGTIDATALAACRAAKPSTCQPSTNFASVGQPCGMLATATGFTTRDCVGSAYCAFKTPGDEAGTCAPKQSAGAACDPTASSAWGGPCARGLTCDAAERRCVATAPPVCAAQARAD